MTYFPNHYRALTVGFDDAVKQLEKFAKSSSAFSQAYPPYNIVKLSETKYAIELAVAGFAKQDIEIELKDDVLVINGKVVTENSDTVEYLYKGVANRAFTRKFNVAETIEVKGAKLYNGMLMVFLENVVPDHKKPQKIDIEE